METFHPDSPFEIDGEEKREIDSIRSYSLSDIQIDREEEGQMETDLSDSPSEIDREGKRVMEVIPLNSAREIDRERDGDANQSVAEDSNQDRTSEMCIEMRDQPVATTDNSKARCEADSKDTSRTNKCKFAHSDPQSASWELNSDHSGYEKQRGKSKKHKNCVSKDLNVLEEQKQTVWENGTDIENGLSEQIVQTHSHGRDSDRLQTVSGMERCVGMEETQKENKAVRQRQGIESTRELSQKTHRKSTLPKHLGSDYRKMGKLTHRAVEKHPQEDKDVVVQRQDTCLTDGDTKEIVSKDDHLLKFAEILYKCSLCATLPCILTSQSAFLRHLKEHHLTTQAAGNQCLTCHLHFQTDTDLQTHVSSFDHCTEEKSFITDGIVSETIHPQDVAFEQETTVLPESDIKNKTGKESDLVTSKNSASAARTRVSGRSSVDQESYSKGNDDSSEHQHALKTLSEETCSRDCSAPSATVEHHSSLHLQRLQMLTSPSISPPPRQQPTEDRRGGVFNGRPEGGGNFSVEFGRFTKLVREGGRIVYFCQVCNVKCQVKAAFQVHCNGLRHHNAVCTAGKNKGGVVTPILPGDHTARTPLKEMSVVGPRLTPPRGDNLFVEKITKYFHDLPDVNAALNHRKHYDLSDVFLSPVNCGMRDHLIEVCDLKSPRGNSKSPENYHLRPSKFSPDSYRSHSSCQSQCSPKTLNSLTSKLNFDRLDNVQNCDFFDSNEDVLSLLPGHRKRTHDTSVSNSELLCSSESDSHDLPSTTSTKCVTDSQCKFSVKNTLDAEAANNDDQFEGPTQNKRAKMDSLSQSEKQVTFNEKPRSTFREEMLKSSQESDLETNQSKATFPNYSDQSQKDYFRSPKKENEECDVVDTNTIAMMASDDVSDSASERDSTPECDITSELDPTSAEDQASEKRVPVSNGNFLPAVDFARAFKDGRCSIERLQQAAAGMLAKHLYPPVASPCLFSGVVGNGWSPDVRGKNRDQFPRGNVGLAPQDTADDAACDSTKGQNNEGWKVTQIRDVLKGLISASSSKSSSVARDVLLHRASLLLRVPDVQHWGPACNRAVRDLFPHCLAQRKGKFKKTYFFGLTLRPGVDEAKERQPVDGTSFRPLRDMTQDLEQLLEHLPGLLYWSGRVEQGVSRDDVLQALAACLSESEVFHWGMQCNKALRMLFPTVLMKRKGKYKTVYFGVDFTSAAKRLLPGSWPHCNRFFRAKIGLISHLRTHHIPW